MCCCLGDKLYFSQTIGKLPRMLKTSLYCLLFLAVVAEATIHTKSCGGCAQYSVDDGNHMSWDEANAYCQKNGGYLVKIENELQQQCINEFLYEIGASGVSVRTGLRKVDGEWRWSVDNTLASSGYQNWKSDEPSGDGPSIHLYRPFTYKWNDVPSNWGAGGPNTYSLCEKSFQRNYCSGDTTERAITMEAVAKYDFNATADDELSFHKNDVIQLLNMEEDSNWYKAEKDGRKGFIPANYIKAKPNVWYQGKMKRAYCELVLLKKSASGNYIQPDGAFMVRLSESTPGDFSLSVKWGESVQHFKILRDGEGRYFLWLVKFASINKLVEYHRTSSVSPSQTIYLRDMVDESPAELVQALYNFEAEEEGELSFGKGTILTVLEKPDANWWMGMDSNGSRGLFPSTYVKAI